MIQEYRTLTLRVTFLVVTQGELPLGAPSYLVSVLTRRVNAKRGSARRVHCTPVRPTGVGSIAGVGAEVTGSPCSE